MTTLVTGATGFLGSAIARELLNDGRTLKLLVRKNTDTRNIDDLDCEVVYGDLRDCDSLKSALKGCKTLYHTAAYYSLWSRDKKLIYDINVEGTRNILQSALSAQVEKVVYTSTVGCIGLTEDRSPANEEQPMNRATLCNDYKLSKFEAEQVAHGFSAKGLPLVIVNPSTPVGPRDIKPTPTGKIILDFLNGKMPAYIDTGLNLIDVADCARGHILAEEKGQLGARYILGNRNMSLKEILLALEAITGLKAPKIKMPYWVAYAAGLACEWASDTITHLPPSVPLAGVKMAKYHMYFDPSKAIRELGLPQNPIENALEQAVRWFRDNPVSS
ncbi:MAG: NAD-dependent epimerase/dehydratase family protein [Nitrospinaceae bacterium]|nr:NAD-dependent epimerase/dehydratase family protein [Nitrospina sp.]MBT5868103.1 NAD-dependent epimerase/dehydratase family protein [Nitrospinaceae bacterium]MBT6347240.1 NAD-dependent epimerase/dehydratase family protein [Nitrospina sp.]